MTYIICEPCVGTCDTACVEVCPVDCIHGPHDKTGAGAEAKVDGFVPEENDSLYIDPEECIDCGACVPECPVEAIFEADDVPEQWTEYIAMNERLAAGWPLIEEQKDPMDCAEEFRDVADKRALLSEAPQS